MCGIKLVILLLKAIFLGDFSFVKIFLKNCGNMTTTLNTSCSEYTMVLSARRRFF